MATPTSDYEEQLDRIAEYADASVPDAESPGIARLRSRFVWAEAVAVRALGERGNAVYTRDGVADRDRAQRLLGVAAGTSRSSSRASARRRSSSSRRRSAEVGTPRNAIIGHFVAIAAAVAALVRVRLARRPERICAGRDTGSDRGGRRLRRADRRGAAPSPRRPSTGWGDDDHRQLGPARGRAARSARVAAGVLLITVAGWALNESWEFRLRSGPREAHAPTACGGRSPPPRAGSSRHRRSRRSSLWCPRRAPGPAEESR